MSRNLSNRFLVRAAFALVLVLLAVTSMSAQGLFATLTGVVTDPTGAVVSGAKVRLHDVASGSERETKTDNDGYYAFASVPVGNYSLTVESRGFQSFKAAGIALGGGERRNVNATLEVGSTSQTPPAERVA